MNNHHDMTERERRISDRAEQLWNEAGQPTGRDDEFWHQAVAEIDGGEALDRLVPRDVRP